jgi:hypothetical protein
MIESNQDQDLDDSAENTTNEIDNVGSEAVSGEAVSGGEVIPSGGDTLFQFDPLDTMSRKRRAKKLESLECWPQVKHMLDNSKPIAEIVHFIQVTRKEFTQVKPQTLKGMLHHWLSSATNRSRLVDHRIPVRHLNLINSNQDRIDPIDAMNMLFAIQMDRVLIDYEKERQRQSTNKTTTASLKLAMDMVKALDSLQTEVHSHTVKVTNTSSTIEQKIDGSLAQMDRMKKIFEERWGKQAAQVMLNDESRNKIFNAISKIRKTSSESFSQIIEQNTTIAKRVIQETTYRDDSDDNNSEIIDVT